MAALPGPRSPVATGPRNNRGGAGEERQSEREENKHTHTHRSPVGAPSDLTLSSTVSKLCVFKDAAIQNMNVEDWVALTQISCLVSEFEESLTMNY